MADAIFGGERLAAHAKFDLIIVGIDKLKGFDKGRIGAVGFDFVAFYAARLDSFCRRSERRFVGQSDRVARRPRPKTALPRPAR